MVDFDDPTVNVYSVRPDGSDLKQLTDFLVCVGCGAPSWTPDGAHILFGGPDTSGPDPSPRTTFWLIDPDGANQRPINTSKLRHDGAATLDGLGGGKGYLQPAP